MVATHERLGLGAFPDPPITIYLARSLSAFYAIVGGLLLLFFIDRSAGLPPMWSLGEGPFVAVLGLVMSWLVRAVPRR